MISHTGLFLKGAPWSSIDTKVTVVCVFLGEIPGIFISLTTLAEVVLFFFMGVIQGCTKGVT